MFFIFSNYLGRWRRLTGKPERSIASLPAVVLGRCWGKKSYVSLTLPVSAFLLTDRRAKWKSMSGPHSIVRALILRFHTAAEIPGKLSPCY